MNDLATTTPPTDEAIAEQVQAAQAEQAALEAEAAQLDAEARDAREAFERAPSETTLVQRDIKAQLAKNRNAKLQAHIEQAAPLLVEHSRRVRAARLAVLRAELAECPGLITASAERIAETYRDFITGVQSELDVVLRTIEHQNKLATEAHSLECSAIGDRREHPRTNLRRALEVLQASIDKRYASTRADRAVLPTAERARLGMGDHGNLQSFHLEAIFNRKIPTSILGG